MKRPTAGHRIRPLLLLAVILGSVILGSVSPATAQIPEAWPELARHFTERVENEGVVGASLVLVEGDRIVAGRYVGLADRASARPVDERTIYHWASITKTFTGIAIMQLRDRGLLTLDDPIVRYVPELVAVHDPFGPVEKITLRMLMSHSAGFRGSTWPWGGDLPWHPHEPTEWSQLVAMMPYTEIEFEPGSHWQYSNPGVVFLGRVIEKLSGEPFETYVDKNILRPLGMHASYFDRTPYHLLADRSNSYYRRGDELIENGLDFDTGITVSNGGLNAPVTDMARYLAFLIGDEAHASTYDRVLTRASLEEMWQPQIALDDTPETSGFMGLSFFLLHEGSATYPGHTGGQKGFVSFIYVDPEGGIGAIAAFNTLGIQSPGGGPLVPDTRDIMADVRQRVFSDIFRLYRR